MELFYSIHRLIPTNTVRQLILALIISTTQMGTAVYLQDPWRCEPPSLTRIKHGKVIRKNTQWNEHAYTEKESIGGSQSY